MTCHGKWQFLLWHNEMTLDLQWNVNGVWKKSVFLQRSSFYPFRHHLSKSRAHLNVYSTYQCCSTRMQDHFLKVSESTWFYFKTFQDHDCGNITLVSNCSPANVYHHTFVIHWKYVFTWGGTEVSLSRWKRLRNGSKSCHLRAKKHTAVCESCNTLTYWHQRDLIWRVLATFSYISRLSKTQTLVLILTRFSRTTTLVSIVFSCI